MAADAPPVRRRRWPLRLAGLLVVLAAAGWFAPTLIARTRLKRAVVAKLNGHLDAAVDVGGLALDWRSPVELRDVTVTDRTGNVIGSAPVVRTSLTLADWLAGPTDLGTITVEKPVVAVVGRAGGSNLEDVLRPLFHGPGSGGPPVAVAVEVVDGTLTLADAGSPTPQALGPVRATVTVPASDRPIGVTVGIGGPGRLAVDLAIGPDVSGTVAGDGFDLSAVGPLVRRIAPGTGLAGRLTANLTGRVGDVAGLSGRAAVDGLRLSGPWVGADAVELARAELPVDVEVRDRTVRVAKAELRCDVGTLSLSGKADPTAAVADLLAVPGLKAAGDLDLAELAATFPALLRVRGDTAVQSGRLKFAVASAAGDRGTGWAGTLETTAVRGTRGGRPVAWDNPLSLAFAGRVRPDGLPEVDKLEARADFVGLAARGGPAGFTARANVDLGRLSARLADFADVGATFSGSAEVSADLKRDGAGFAAAATARLTKFAARDAAGRWYEEPDLRVEAKAAGAWDGTGPVRLDGASADLTAGADVLAVRLLGPLADARSAADVGLSATAGGDVGRWWQRLSPLVGREAARWQVGGTGTVSADCHPTRDAVRVPKFAADLADVRFRGLGLVVDEPQLKADGKAEWDRRTGAVALTDVRLTSPTVGASARRIDLRPTADGLAAAGTVGFNADILRAQRTVGMVASPDDPSAARGRAVGEVAFDLTADGAVRFDGHAKAEPLSVGPAAKPTWAEPWVKAAAAGKWEPTADRLAFDTLRVERDGLTADGSGKVMAVRGPAPEVDFAGTTAYDLARLEPTLKAYLGPGARAAGKETRPFRLSGPLAGPRVGALSGSAAVGWQSLKAYGFEVGPGELTAGLGGRAVRFSPVEAVLGGGRVKVVPGLDLTPGRTAVTAAPGRVVTRAKLTPEAAADAIGFALPSLAGGTRVDGLVSVDLADTRIPLADPTKATVAGTLTVHSATASAGPLASELGRLLGADDGVLTLATEQAVAVKVADGRVYHDRFAMTVGRTTVATTGSVGLDGSLGLTVDVAVPPKLVAAIKDPRVRDALSRRTIAVPVGGTLWQPQLDPRGFRQAVRELTRDTAREAVGGLLDGLLRRELERREKK